MPDWDILHVRYNTRGLDYVAPPHRQQHWQWYAVIEGAVRSVVDDEQRVLGPYSCQFLAPGCRRMHVCDREPLRYLIIDFTCDLVRLQRLGSRKLVIPVALRRLYSDLLELLDNPSGNDAGVLIRSMSTTVMLQLARGVSLHAEAQVRDVSREADEVVAVVDNYLQHHLHRSIKREDIATLVGCTDVHLGRLYKKAAGQTIWQKLTHMRLQRAAELLRGSDLQITDIALEVGYASFSQFSAAFRRAIGCTASQYRTKTSHP